MKAKFYFLFLLSSILAQTGLFAQLQQSGFIIYVSDNEVDSGFVQLLQEENFEVVLKGSEWSQMLTAEQLDSANAAALIILSRNLASTDFDPSANAGVDNQWNGINVPIVSLSPWIIRSNRLQWFNSTEVSCNNDTITVAMANDPVFNGINTDDPLPIYDDPDRVAGSDWMNVETNGPGNADVLATDADGNLIAMALFIDGTNFYSETSQVAGNDRLWFSAGKSDCGGAEEPDALYNLNADGEQMFLNLVDIYVAKIGASINQSMADQVNVYPNPVIDLVSIEGLAVIDMVEVVTLNGKIVKTVLNTTKFDVSELADGLYILKIHTGDNVLTSRFVKR